MNPLTTPPPASPPSDDTPPLTDEQRNRLKRLLLKKGAEINEKLVALMNNQQPNLSALLPGGKPGEKPIERLRRFMALVDGRLRALREGSYGRCERCNANLPFAHLEQIPWIDTCQKCAKELAEAT